VRPTTPEPNERLRDALEYLLGTSDDRLGRARARVSAAVAGLAADAQGLSERVKADGADAVDAAMAAMHARELAKAVEDLATLRERQRELFNVIEFADRATHRRKS